MSKTRTSAAIQLLDLVWANANKGTDHSYERLNNAMRSALSLVVGAGFEFAEGDVKHVIENYRSGYWIGESAEWIYCEAITVGNMSAVKSFEACKSREPFIADDVEPSERYSKYLHLVGKRQRERLAVGFSFPWKGVVAKVTSFADDSAYVTACTYKGKDSDYPRKIDKRFKITRADIIADRAERKERAALLDKLTKAAESNGNSTEICEALGVSKRDDYARLPIATIRKVAARYLDPATPPVKGAVAAT